MRRRAIARRGVAQLVRVLSGVGDQLLHVVGGHRRVHHQDVGQVADTDDGREAGFRVVALLLVQADIDGQRAGGAEQDGVAVGLGVGDVFGADVAAGAAAVLDDDVLLERLSEFFGQAARQGVGGAARRKGHDQRDGPRRRVGLRGQCGRGRGDGGGGRQQPGGEGSGHGCLQWVARRLCRRRRFLQRVLQDGPARHAFVGQDGIGIARAEAVQQHLVGQQRAAFEAGFGGFPAQGGHGYRVVQQ
ncbi:hypothetical protein D3C72_1550370 [compost metagenome]